MKRASLVAEGIAPEAPHRWYLGSGDNPDLFHNVLPKTDYLKTLFQSPLALAVITIWDFNANAFDRHQPSCNPKRYRAFHADSRPPCLLKLCIGYIPKTRTWQVHELHHQHCRRIFGSWVRKRSISEFAESKLQLEVVFQRPSANFRVFRVSIASTNRHHRFGTNQWSWQAQFCWAEFQRWKHWRVISCPVWAHECAPRFGCAVFVSRHPQQLTGREETLPTSCTGICATAIGVTPNAKAFQCESNRWKPIEVDRHHSTQDVSWLADENGENTSKLEINNTWDKSTSDASDVYWLERLFKHHAGSKSPCRHALVQLRRVLSNA